MEELVSVRISKGHHELLQKLCKRDDIKFLKDYIEKMLEYFDQTGLEPGQNVKSISGELSKLRNVVVSFIREQEKTKLDPLIGQFNDLTEFLIDHFKNKALTKEDLRGALSSFNASVELPQRATKETPEVAVEKAPSLEDSLYKSKLERARTYFREFLTHFKPSTFSNGLTIEKKTVKHYESLFEQL